MTFKFDPIQEEAISKIRDWFIYGKSTKKYFTLAGRAGTGKSTIISEAISTLGISLNEVAFVAPTGKAAEVMHNKGNEDATTLHALIYYFDHKDSDHIKKTTTGGDMKTVIEKLCNGEEVSSEEVTKKINQARVHNISNVSKGELHFVKKEALSSSLKLIVVDEASMVADEQIEDLESFDIPVLYVGDHHQLKPVKGFNSRISKPDITLEKIHRQDGESGILELANEILDNRKGYIPRNWSNMQDVIFMNFGFFVSRFSRYGIEYPDQLLCGTNKMRCMLNAYVRKLLGFKTPFPEEGDKLICTKNNFDIGIYNGMQGIVKEVISTSVNTMLISFLPFGKTESITMQIDKTAFLPPNANIEIDQEAEKFDFGYACTVHKSQGSEWKNVTYIEAFFGEETRSLNYTAATRAKEKLVVVFCPTKEEQEMFLGML